MKIHLSLLAIMGLAILLALPSAAPAPAPVLVDDCLVDEPDPQAAAYSADLTFSPCGDAAHLFIRRKVQAGETDAAWRTRICEAIAALSEASGCTATIVDHKWLVP